MRKGLEIVGYTFGGIVTVISCLACLAACTTLPNFGGGNGTGRVIINPDGSGTLVYDTGTSSTVQIVWPGRTPATSGKTKTLEK